MPLLFTTIASGFNVSDILDLTKHRLVGIQVPVINSGDLAFRGSFDPTSALFTRIADASGDLRFPIQAGSKSVAAPEQLSAFPYLKLETLMPVGSAQTSPRTLVALVASR